ncbi:MAG: 50S ribosome-binding GTPase [Omnitrophica bacterium]|nr:50S ribosome-binding GTPase [Candidatus Omnitrophota bacterium]
MPEEGSQAKEKMIKIAIVGSPNVGKSVLFNALTKRYVTVSNYPGTTVEVSRGTAKIDSLKCEVIDTPGMYSLLPVTEEERVARRILIDERPNLVIHVVDAKNLERMLTLTLQLIEAGLSLILVLNIMDEAQREGVTIDARVLERELSIPVIKAVSTKAKGIDALKQGIKDYAERL